MNIITTSAISTVSYHCSLNPDPTPHGATPWTRVQLRGETGRVRCYNEDDELPEGMDETVTEKFTLSFAKAGAWSRGLEALQAASLSPEKAALLTPDAGRCSEYLWAKDHHRHPPPSTQGASEVIDMWHALGGGWTFPGI